MGLTPHPGKSATIYETPEVPWILYARAFQPVHVLSNNGKAQGFYVLVDQFNFDSNDVLMDILAQFLRVFLCPRL